jgi:hypothetical protein
LSRLKEEEEGKDRASQNRVESGVVIIVGVESGKYLFIDGREEEKGEERERGEKPARKAQKATGFPLAGTKRPLEGPPKK